MPTLAELVASVRAEGTEIAKRKLHEVGEEGDQTRRKIDRLNDEFKQVGANFRKFAGIAAGGFAGGFLLQQVIQSSIEAERVTAQLNAVIASTAGIAGTSTQGVLDLAKSLQQVTTFGDEAIASTTGLLLTFTNIRGDALSGATAAVLDLATAMKQDLNSAALQVGKALNDPKLGITALARSGIQFSESQKDVIKRLVETGDTAKAQGIILEELERQFGGSARAARNTFAGALIALNETFGDLLEADSLGGATREIENFNALLSDPSTQAGADFLIATMVAGFSNITGQVLGSAEAISTLVRGLDRLLERVPGLTVFQNLLGDGLLGQINDRGVLNVALQPLEDYLDKLDEADRKRKELMTGIIDRSLTTPPPPSTPPPPLNPAAIKTAKDLEATFKEVALATDILSGKFGDLDARTVETAAKLGILQEIDVSGTLTRNADGTVNYSNVTTELTDRLRRLDEQFKRQVAQEQAIETTKQLAEATKTAATDAAVLSGRYGDLDPRVVQIANSLGILESEVSVIPARFTTLADGTTVYERAIVALSPRLEQLNENLQAQARAAEAADVIKQTASGAELYAAEVQRLNALLPQLTEQLGSQAEAHERINRAIDEQPLARFADRARTVAAGATSADADRIQALNDDLAQARDALESGELDEEQYRRYTDTAIAEFNRLGEASNQLRDDIKSAVDNTVLGVADAFVEMRKTGEFNFRALTEAIIDDMIRITIRALITRAITQSIFSGQTTIPQSNTSQFGPVQPSARGNAFNDSSILAQSRAIRGGAIVSEPIAFPMTGNQTGTAAESGPEAIMPLVRTPSGDLGIKSTTISAPANVILNNNTKTEMTATAQQRGRDIIVELEEKLAARARTGGPLQNAILSLSGSSRPTVSR